MSKFIPISTAVLIAGAVFASPATTEAQSSGTFVDPTMSAASCNNYSAATRACSGGTSTAYRTIAGAAAAATAGTVISLREGTYREALNPPRSGSRDAPIVFQRHGSETPTITGVDIGLTIIGREYIEVNGLTVTDVSGWARLQDARYVTIRNSTFRRATSTGTTGGFKIVRSTYNRILGNVLQDGNDNMVLVDAADRNVIEDNTFSTGRHSLLSVRCSNFNVFRANSFSNPSQKAIEIYDCEGVGSDSPIRLDAAHRNLFERNEVTKTLASSRDHDYNGIQHGAQQTILRRNVFRGNDGGAVHYQNYADESLYVYGNRMYHNTFYANKCHAIIGASGSSNYRDNRSKNNLLYKNVTCSGGATQTRIADTGAVVLTSNAIETADPGFVNEAGNDFHLTAGSRMVGAAAALTTTSSAGSGTTVAVQDASYFFDGYGIPAEVGDVIQLIGRPDFATVTAINYTANTLTLDRPWTWSSGEGVTLQYSGNAPDMGAFEYGEAAQVPLRPPTHVRIVNP
jgi:hypothetical protein